MRQWLSPNTQRKIIESISLQSTRILDIRVVYNTKFNKGDAINAEIEFTEEEIAEFRESFSLYDKDGDGKITANELAPVMRAIGMNPTEDELLDKARDIDKNHNGCIDFAGFLQMNAEQMRENAAEKQDESFLKDAFKSFDINGSGLIPSDKLREAMLTLGEKLTEEEADEMIQLGDKNKGGEVNYEELANLMLSI